MAGYDDPNHDGNSEKYLTGKLCIEPDCDQPAGTAWGPHWCFEHNVKRLNRIDEQFTKMVGTKGAIMNLTDDEIKAWEEAKEKP